MPRHPETVIIPNVLVAAARTRIPSPRRAGQCMSRAELADAVNDALHQLHPRRKLDALYVDRRWIGKLERGEHRWPSPERRAALRHVLNAADDTDLGLYNPRRTDSGGMGLDSDDHGLAPRYGLGPNLLPAGDLLQLGISASGRQLLTSDPSLCRTISAPQGQHFPGTAIDVELYPAVDDGRVLATIALADMEQRWRRSVQRRLILGYVDGPERVGVFALDSRRAYRHLVEAGRDARLLIPRVYQLDAITAAVLWAVANLDLSLLLDDARLDAARAAASPYRDMARSAASQDIAEDLDSVSQLWIGSAFCADHIRRHYHVLSGVPVYWTREQRGEEASTWLLFRHKLRYLRETADRFRSITKPMTRMFCVPSQTVAASSISERILLLLALALMESFGIRTAVTDDPKYATLPGLVMDNQRAVIATWIRADDVWHVDVTDHRNTIATYRDALGDVHAHSVTADDTPAGRLRHLADYLALDWHWLQSRCADLGQYGFAGLAEPRSRLLSLDGVDQACRFIGTLP
ncbi:XRE family transcriptional regulator [Micromonospora sp. WMMD1082]|uniref:helix-turn-helix domain-containing protein n=1 Tax=Micromonospora sp. WMMD1082 TaxID=3016104 RepID=UPI0024171F6C|nr:XRE family transcriptional regulator [Micromonospora sp. WMMD1082]MDG4795163.1 XRE family transcriptional regulator [Micromonospora sp. WMMD1082]